MSGYTRAQLDNIRIARQAAKAAHINPHIFLRQMQQEAHFSDLTSPAGAQGPAQIMPGTARAWHISNVHDPRQAYYGAAQHMASYLHQFGGDWAKALTAYNAGPGAVGGALPAETQNYIHTILGGHDVVAPSSLPAAPNQAGSVTAGTRPTLTPGGTSLDTRAVVTAALEDPRKGMSLAQRILGAATSGQYTTTQVPVVTPGQAPKYSVGQPATSASGGYLSRITARADAVDSRHLPYAWGGGHGGKVAALKQAVPVDCSGAVSEVLGINPRVSGQFETWGKPGDGGNRGITVYANGHHVIMKINGRFFGTSGSNPGGGAGWIPSSVMSRSYLSQFTARHE